MLHRTAADVVEDEGAAKREVVFEGEAVKLRPVSIIAITITNEPIFRTPSKDLASMEGFPLAPISIQILLPVRI